MRMKRSACAVRSDTFVGRVNRPATTSSPLIPLLVATLAFVAGLQLLRGALAGLSVYLGQVRDLDPLLLGMLIFAIFLTGFAAPLIRRLPGARWAFLILAAGLALLLLAEQFVGQPDVRLALDIAGVVLWLWLVQLVIVGDHAPEQDHSAAPAVIVLLLGLMIDTAIKGAFGTLDLSAAAGLAPRLTTIALTSVQLALILSLARTRTDLDAAKAPAASAFAVGPALALQLLFFQNIAGHTALVGWTLPASLAWTLAANLVAIGVALALIRRGSAVPRWASLAAAGLLIASLVPNLPVPLVAVGAFVGPVAIAVLMATALAGRATARVGWIAAALGLLAIPLVLFGWYAHYEIAVPVPQWLIPLVAGVLVAGHPLSGTFARVRSLHLPRSAGEMSWSDRGGLALLDRLSRRCCHRDLRPPSAFGISPQRGERGIGSGISCRFAGGEGCKRLLSRCRGGAGMIVVVGALLLLLLPLHQVVTWNSPSAPPAGWHSLRVLTYNIHQGFDLSGRPGLEAIAAVIEAEQPQIVALQEVPRGWVVNGAVDALSWLAQRLEMHAAWGLSLIHI